jgi:dynein heavy chain
MQPKLEVAAKQTAEMMIIIAKEQEEANETQKIVAKDEIVATKQAQEAQVLKDDAQESVREANLILEETLKEVSKLKKDHIVEVKALTKPPEACVVILGALSILC